MGATPELERPRLPLHRAARPRSGTLEILRAEGEGPSAVGRALGARVPGSWPPPVFEPDDLARIRRQFEESTGHPKWTLHYVLRRAAAQPELVGVAGYFGPPSPDGAVEIGYAIAEEHQRRGYATEAVEALVAGAFEDPAVQMVTATTYVTLEPSIGVLRKTGFSHVRSDPATGLVHYERRRVLR